MIHVTSVVSRLVAMSTEVSFFSTLRDHGMFTFLMVMWSVQSCLLTNSVAGGYRGLEVMWIKLHVFRLHKFSCIPETLSSENVFQQCLHLGLSE